MEVTTMQFSKMNKVDYALAAGFLKFLEQKGVVKNLRTEKSPNGKGKGSIVYDVPNEISVNHGIISLME